jgi:hypothetical protein
MTDGHPVQFDVEYPDRDLNRLTTFFRAFIAIPIAIVLATVSGAEASSWYDSGAATDATTTVVVGAGGILFAGPLLMILFRQKYPRWSFDWNLELTRFSNRVGIYLALMDDRDPSTDEAQSPRCAAISAPLRAVQRFHMSCGGPVSQWEQPLGGDPALAAPHARGLLCRGLRGSGSRLAGTGQDRGYERTLGFRIEADLLPVARRELALEALVGRPIVRRGSQAVAEGEVVVGLLVTNAQDVDVNAQVGCAEHAMAGFADAQNVPGALEAADERCLIVDIRHDHQHVDDRLGREPGHRR